MRSCAGPSGRIERCLRHAIITFTIAGLLALVLPRRWVVVAFVLAGLNAVARVYLGAHNPLDVVGGAAVGLAIAAALDLVADVARDRGSRPERTPRRRTGPPELEKQGPASPGQHDCEQDQGVQHPRRPPLGWRTDSGPGLRVESTS
jgi:hypothetical protein